VLGSAFLAPVSTYAQQRTAIQPGIRTSLAQVRFVDGPQRSIAPILTGTTGTTGNGRESPVATGEGRYRPRAPGDAFWRLAGAAFEGNCRCDEPGLAGGMIGASVGGVAGAMLGWHLGQ
jgi:hypothetical protein